MSVLAEAHAGGKPLSSQEIANARNFSQPLVAKVLTHLSQAGLITGTRGPGGGYRLARKPGEITILDVVTIFEGHRDLLACPFGPGWCGVGDPCPLHDTLVALSDTAARRLEQKTFAAFVDHPPPSPDQRKGSSKF